VRILMLAPRPHVRGPLLRTATMLAGPFRDLGHAVTTLPWGRDRDDETPAAKAAARARDIARVRAALARRSYDLLFVHTSHDRTALARDLPLALAVRDRRPAVVMQFHGSDPDLLLRPGNAPFKLATWLLLSLTDAVLVLSSEEQAAWRRFAPRRRFFVVDYPFMPLTAAASCGPNPATSDGLPIVLFAGRLMAEKGILDLIDAMPAVLRRAPCRLIVAGDGPEAGRARARVAALRLNGDVTFAGYLQGADLAAAYRQAALLALPTYHQEGFPNVIGEAMQAGLPVVTTRIRGAADHLHDEKHALFVPPRDPDALAAAIVRLVTDAGLRARMARANREKAEEFRPEIVARRYLDVFERVLASLRR
jgi:glycosyltransferase involved in cell wall biosynthesis